MKFKSTDINLVPSAPNTSPDYYCTWQTQLYATSDGKPHGQRAMIGERALFDREKPYGWAYFYEQARGDLYIVMDDSWDVPVDGDLAYLGCLQLSGEKFPSYAGEGGLSRLTDAVRALGWRGLGGWVCAQESPMVEGDKSPEVYWVQRLKEANAAGLSYWKVDWGDRAYDPNFRRSLTEWGREYARGLTIEHSMLREIIPHTDVFRTYDVPAIMSIPMTMEKISGFADLSGEGTTYTAKGILDCEDEVYMAASGGFAMGVMRHPYVGELPDGRPDMSFPSVHRNLKTKMYEVIRATRWHRIAPAFSLGLGKMLVSETILSDTWRFEDREAELEAWWFTMDSIKNHLDGEFLTKNAPAAIARNTNLPHITPDENGDIPYCVAARNPNGAFSVVTLGRTRDRDYFIPRCDVTVDIGNADTIGVFCEYRNVILKTDRPCVGRILMQDLAADEAFDVTHEVTVADGCITVPGELIHRIGTMAQPEGDTSEPGVVLCIQ